jgi:hypothetical protein
MSKSTTVSIRDCFADVADPRREHLRLHSLWEIIAITILAVVSGADSWVEVAEYGVKKFEFLRTFLELVNGIPSHDTFGRVFALLSPSALQDGFVQWVQAVAESTLGRVVAIDGKTARRSFDKTAGKGPLHMVSAWAIENRLLLGQQACDSKSNEITAMPELIRNLEISGAIVTSDAMGCQKGVTRLALRRVPYSTTTCDDCSWQEGPPWRRTSIGYTDVPIAKEGSGDYYSRAGIPQGP